MHNICLSINVTVLSAFLKPICSYQQTPHYTLLPCSYFSSLCTGSRPLGSIQATSHILTHLQDAFQFLSPLHRLCPFVYVPLNESFIAVTQVLFMYFYLKCVLLFDELLLRRGLNHTKSIECACTFGCVGLCLRVFQIWWHGSVLFLKRYVGASEAHGSSCCVPSYFPGSVSIWLYAGCSSETPRRLKTQSRYPGPSGCFASLGCFLVPGHSPHPHFVDLSGYSGSVLALPLKELQSGSMAFVMNWLAASGYWEL